MRETVRTKVSSVIRTIESSVFTMSVPKSIYKQTQQASASTHAMQTPTQPPSEPQKRQRPLKGGGQEPKATIPAGDIPIRSIPPSYTLNLPYIQISTERAIAPIKPQMPTFFLQLAPFFVAVGLAALAVLELEADPDVSSPFGVLL